MRATTLKADRVSVPALVDYYAGLAADQLHRDGLSRGPMDYYLDPNEPPGRWWGQGCTAVDLAGDVRPEQLAAMLQARHPVTAGASDEGSVPSRPGPSTPPSRRPRVSRCCGAEP